MSRFARHLAGIACAAIASVASAWVPIGTGVWRDGSVPLAFEFAAGAPGNSVAWSAVAGEALAAWNAELQRVQLITAPLTGRPWYDNGRNELFFDAKAYGVPFSRQVLAVTLITTDNDEHVETDIVFNPNETWSVYAGPLRAETVDFRRVMIHELGHVLGLDHPDEWGQTVPAIMNAHIGDTGALTADDKAGGHGLYDRVGGAPPLILQQPASRDGKQGAPVIFTVVAGGRGPYSYTWQRNGVLLPGATGASLQFVPVLADAGDYSVVVRNAGGAVTSQAARLTVTLSQPPTVNIRPATATAIAGETVVIESLLGQGSSYWSIAWSRNGVAIAGATAPILRLTDVQRSDAGDYTVSMTNEAGTTTSSVCRLSVTPTEAPRLTGELPSRAVAPNSGSVILNAPVVVSQPAQYEWYRNGVKIPGASGATLAIASFGIREVGSYTVTVTNTFGSVTSGAANLTLLSASPLRFAAQPASIDEFPGAEVTFFTTPNSVQATLRWFKDGVLISDPSAPPSGTATARILGAFGFLRITDIAPSDAGVYTAEITDGTDLIVSRGARLRVMPAGRPVIKVQPAPHSVPIGGAVNLGVTPRQWLAEPSSREARLDYTFQWFKEGQPLAGQTRESLSFSAQLADAGRYFVRVGSRGGTTDSDIVNVSVTSGPAPVMLMHPPNWLFDSGYPEDFRLASIVFEIWMRRALAVNPDSYVWRWDNVVFSTQRSPFPLPSFPGNYSLSVTRGGVTETTGPFTFGNLPIIVPVLYRHPQGRVTGVGETVHLTVAATAFGPLTYRWTKDGVLIPGATSASYSIAAMTASQAGTYRVDVTSAAGTATSEPAVLELRPGPGPVISDQPVGREVIAGTPLTLQVAAIGLNLRFQWLRNGQPVAGATAATFTIPNAGTADSGLYSVVVNDTLGSVISRAVQVRVLPLTRAPEIVIQPASQTAVLGDDATLVVGAIGTPPPDRYQWRKNGVDVPGATDAKLRLRGIQPEAAGTYTVVVGNALGSVTSLPATLTVDPAARLVNLATRAAVGTGGNILIAGFVLSGPEARNVLVRGIGDQLTDFGLTGVLRNPTLRVFNSKGELVANSDDWVRLTNDARAELAAAARQVGAFPLREDTRDSALIATLAPGSYTAQVSGFLDTTGVALVEIYELGKPGPNQLINLSSRAVVGTGPNILIPGLVLTGLSPRRLLLRAVGPGLADFGVADTLADPIMTLYRDRTVLAENDNWSSQSDSETIRQTMAAVGAFALRPGSQDSALLLDLPPGNYTIQVAGVRGATGVALVEVYEVLP